MASSSVQVTDRNRIIRIAFVPFTPTRDINNLHVENPRRQVEVVDQDGENPFL